MANIIRCAPGDYPEEADVAALDLTFLQSYLIGGANSVIASPVPLGPNRLCTMWVNEEAGFSGEPPNIWATSLLRAYNPHWGHAGVLVGPVILAGGNNGCSSLSLKALKVLRPLLPEPTEED